MKKFLFPSLILVLVTSFTLQSCKEEIEDYVPREFIGADASYLRVINTASFPRRVDYVVNNQKVNGDSLAYNASFPTSEFLRVPSGSVTFKANAPGLGTDVFSSSFTFEQGKYNTLFLIDTLPTIDAYLVTDNQLVPPADSGKAYVRFVNVAKDAGRISVANTTTATAVDTVFKNVAYKSHTDFIKVNSGGGQKFQMYVAGTTTKIGAEMTAVTLTPNRIYTIYARGRSGTKATAYAPTLSIITTR